MGHKQKFNTIIYQIKIRYTFECMSGEVYLVPVASISAHTKPRDKQNLLYQQDFDAVQSLYERKPTQYITLLPKDIPEH